MGGWAARFVRAGASAFIGSLWEVNDELAAKFAIKFYTELLAGQTLGDAFHAARAHIRDRRPGQPHLAGLHALRRPERPGQTR